MKLTPLDIKKQEFKKSLRGFDPVEVETFLEMVADEFESLIREKNNLADDVLKLKTQLRNYQEVEKTLQETLMAAQQSVNESRQNSQREAGLLIREAEIKAEKVLEEAKLKLAELKNELLVVKAQKDSFAKRLRHLLASELELLEVLEIDDLGFEGKTGDRRKSARKPQDEIVFKGADELARHPNSEDEAAKPSVEEAANAKWEKEKKSRISDQLIF